MAQPVVKLPLSTVQILDEIGTQHNHQDLPLKKTIQAPNLEGKSREFKVNIVSASQVEVSKKFTLNSGSDWFTGDNGDAVCKVVKHYTVKCMSASGFYPQHKPMVEPLPHDKLKAGRLSQDKFEAERLPLPASVNGWLANAKTSCPANREPLTLILDIDSTVKIIKRENDCSEHLLKHTPEKLNRAVHFSPSRMKELLQLQLNGHNIKVLSCGNISQKDLHLIFAQYGIFLPENNVETVRSNKATHVEAQGFDKSHLFLSANSGSHKCELKNTHSYFIEMNANFPRFS
ncbi:hypothetical protein SOPP22_06535 [Shewanella sp. OPT22]|nr:hypothetical protein SOPP22_06535 [Shewanella sp. OPT22]